MSTFALWAVVFRVIELAAHPSFTDQDLPPLEVDVFPL